MTAETIHTCSYSCERPGCIRAQRDELAARLTAAMSQPAGDAEAKTVPVPTRVHLIGETAVIVGTPGRGWDEDAQDAHNCDAMGCATIGPHVLARVPFTDERAMSQAAEAQAQGGGEVVQRLRGVLEHGKMGDKCLIAPDLVTDAIASLSAQQSPAEAQPVAKLVNRKDADGGKTTTFIRPTSLGMDLPLGEYPLHLHPPPSAPVGVDAADALRIVNTAIEVCNLRDRPAMAEDLETVRWYIEQTADLAQQPAAVDGMAELVGLLDEVRSHFTRDDDLPDDLLPRIDAALAAQQQGGRADG